MISYEINGIIGDEPQTAEMHVNVGTKFTVLPRKNRNIARGILHNGTYKIKQNIFITEIKNILEDNTRKAPIISYHY